jgi:hypothetical protein
MELVEHIKYIYVHVVRLTVECDWSNVFSQNDMTNTERPKDLIEVYLNEDNAIQRANELKSMYPISSLTRINVQKHMAITCDEGQTITLIDCLNTFRTQ